MERINLWQHYPGSIGGDQVLAMFFEHADVLPSLRNNYIPNGDILFESIDPDDGVMLFDAFCEQFLGEFNATGEFNDYDLAMISEHIWNGSLHFDSAGLAPFC